MDRAKYRIINAANRQPLRDTDIVEAGPNDRVGKRLCIVHPALLRNGGKWRSDIIVTKATILASLDRPISRAEKTKTHAGGKVDPGARGDEKKHGRGWFEGSWKGRGFGGHQRVRSRAKAKIAANLGKTSRDLTSRTVQSQHFSFFVRSTSGKYSSRTRVLLCSNRLC
jgi:hypothetical protein